MHARGGAGVPDRRRSGVHRGPGRGAFKGARTARAPATLAPPPRTGPAPFPAPGRSLSGHCWAAGGTPGAARAGGSALGRGPGSAQTPSRERRPPRPHCQVRGVGGAVPDGGCRARAGFSSRSPRPAARLPAPGPASRARSARRPDQPAAPLHAPRPAARGLMS